MNIHRRRAPLAPALLAATAAVFNCIAGQAVPADAAPQPETDNVATPVASIVRILSEGKLLLNARARYEYADQDGFRESHAATFRTRLGYETAPLYGFRGLLEFEDVRILGNEDNFNQAGLSGVSPPPRTVVADVETTEVNQAWMSYERWKSVVRGGRQRITLDDHRFIGNVGWRQNEQTFDAVVFQNNSLPDTALFYSYIHNVNRIFGDDHPAGDFDSNSHLFHAAYSGFPYGTLSGYAYLLDLDNSPINSSDTYGASFHGEQPVGDDAKVNYRAQYAYQSDAGDNPIDYDAHYYRVEIGGTYQRFSAGAGYELLGSGANGIGFSTPLATLHAFNGWADTFLVTPANGLEDIYAWAGVKLPYDMPLKFVYHDFESDTGGVDYGREYDVVISKVFAKRLTALAKYAYYVGDGGLADRQKVWLQLEFAF